MVLSPTAPGVAGGFRRRMSLRESLRRVGSRLRQSAVRKCRAEVRPTGGPVGGEGEGPTVKRCRLEYLRLDSGVEPVVGSGAVTNVNQYEVIRENEYEEIDEIREEGIDNDAQIDWEEHGVDEKCEDVVRRSKYEVTRSKKNSRVVSNQNKECKLQRKSSHRKAVDSFYMPLKNEYEVVRKEKKKKTAKNSCSEKVNPESYPGIRNNPQCVQDKFEVGRDKGKPTYTNALDEFLDNPENNGTLNLAFEDFTLKSNLSNPRKSSLRQPLQEIQPALDDSFKENHDPNTPTVRRKRKYSVRFEIDEIIQEDTPSRKFGDVIFDRRARRSNLKTQRHSQDEDDSTEELLIKNYELLTKEGCVLRAESNTDKFARERLREPLPVDTEEECSSEEEIEDLPLPVVSFYCEPQDRMPSRKNAPPCRRKLKKKNPQYALEHKVTTGDIKVLGISTTDALNQPSTLRTDRLAKIVQKFGPEVLMAMGEDGGDSVLAQFKKTLEKPRIEVRGEESRSMQDEADQDCEKEVMCRRGKKRKIVEDIYGKSIFNIYLSGLIICFDKDREKLNIIVHSSSFLF